MAQIAVQIAVADAPAFGRTDQRKIDAKVQRPLPDSGGCKHPALWGCAFSLDLFARRLFRRGCLGRIRFFRSEAHTSELPVTNAHLVCRLLLETKKHTNLISQHHK